MNYTTNFNLNKPEGTDLYNHLTIDNPNMDIIDGAMQANKLASVGAATELVSGTVHAITRTDSNQNIFKFKATGDFKAGDTITVDGVSVSAYNTSGQQLLDDAYVLSAEVLCILDGTSLWILVNKTPDASEIPYDSTFNVKEMIQKDDDIIELNAENRTQTFFTTYPNGKDAYTSEARVCVPFFKKSSNVALTGLYTYDANGQITNLTTSAHIGNVNNISVMISMPFDSSQVGKLLRVDLSN